MKSFRAALLLLALVGFAPDRASAQLPLPFALSVEVLPGYAVPLGDFASAENGVGASAGPSISAGATLGFGTLAAYGQYQYTRFGCERCAGGGLDEQVNDFGWEAGAQLRLALPLLPVTPWVRGGVVGHQLQFSGDGGTVNSEQGIGFAAGAGAELALPGSLRLAPSVSYRSYTADFDFQNVRDQSADVSAAVLSLGLVYRF